MAVYNKIFNETDWENVLESNKEILQDFLMEYKQQQKKPSTIAQYNNDGRIILIYILKKCGNQSILDLKKKDFRKFSLWLTEEKGMSAARANRMMSCLRSILTFCENEDEYQYEQNFAAKVKGIPKDPVREIVFLSNDEVVQMVETLIEREEYQKATLLSLMFDSAGRKNEIAQVQKYSFLDDSKNCTNVVIGKRGKKFPLLYFSMTKRCAKLWLEQRGEDDIDSMWVLRKRSNLKDKKELSSDVIYAWIVGMHDLYKELFPEGDADSFSPHSFRHSSLESMSTGDHYICKEVGAEGGFPLEKLKLVANHESIETTASYLKDKSSQELESMFGIKLE